MQQQILSYLQSTSFLLCSALGKHCYVDININIKPEGKEKNKERKKFCLQDLCIQNYGRSFKLPTSRQLPYKYHVSAVMVKSGCRLCHIHVLLISFFFLFVLLPFSKGRGLQGLGWDGARTAAWGWLWLWEQLNEPFANTSKKRKHMKTAWISLSVSIDLSK